MPTDLNINLLRRHVILTTYFVHTIAIVAKHAAPAKATAAAVAAHELMRKKYHKLCVYRRVHIVLPKMPGDRPRKRPKK